MPKLPRISGKECISILKTLGFEEARQKGSHVVLKMGEAGCVVPMHTELRTGTLHQKGSVPHIHIFIAENS